MNKSRKKAQVATEFMLYTAIFMFMAIAAFIVVNQLLTNEIPLQQNMVAKEAGENFANVLTLSVKGGKGFFYNYTFPKTMFGNPYKIYLTNLDDDFMLMEWEGRYGNFSYSYNIPPYNYKLSGGSCLANEILVSNDCSNVLKLYNDGENLTISQES